MLAATPGVPESSERGRETSCEMYPELTATSALGDSVTFRFARVVNFVSPPGFCWTGESERLRDAMKARSNWGTMVTPSSSSTSVCRK